MLAFGIVFVRRFNLYQTESDVAEGSPVSLIDRKL